MMEHEHFKHASGNSTYISPDDWPRVDAVVGWLIEKNWAGYKMVNSVRRLEDMSLHGISQHQPHADQYRRRQAANCRNGIAALARTL
jgi:hypothetical protein